MAKNEPQIDEEQLYTGLDYLRQGIKSTLERKNLGYLTAFSNKHDNEKGFPILRGPFLEVLEEFACTVNLRRLPEVFTLYIKYSPIAQFKRWIFTLSNKKFLAVSERAKEFEREFYFLKLKDKLFFQPILTNIAHEKFLLNLYEREKIPETITSFSTYFDDNKKLILYKDYLKKKISTVKINQELSSNTLYPVRVNYLKSFKGIKFRVTVNNGNRINHAVRISTIGETTKAKNPDKKPEPSKPFKLLEEYRSEVVEVLKKFKETKKSTNKFANISLGRINKISVLVNLPSKIKNTPVIMTFNRKKELVVTSTSGEVLKIFVVSTSPRSNWLEKK